MASFTGQVRQRVEAVNAEDDQTPEAVEEIEDEDDELTKPKYRILGVDR